MEYTFSPIERIQNILAVLESLQSRLYDCDIADREIWNNAIKQQLINLNEAVTDMKSAELKG